MNKKDVLYMFMCCVSLVAQSRPILCDAIGCSLPGSSVHGLFQARILEWVAMSSSRGSFPTQGSNPDLLHCRLILYHLSHQSIYVYVFSICVQFIYVCVQLFIIMKYYSVIKKNGVLPFFRNVDG